MIDNPLALDLLSKMMALDPRDRITAKEALRHDFFKPLTRQQEIFLTSKNDQAKGTITKMSQGLRWSLKMLSLTY